MGCAPTRISRPGKTEECDTSNETHQGPPNGTQGYLVACYRNIVDTKPGPKSDRKSNRKP